MVKLHASVITGFESVSGNEVRSTLHTDPTTIGRGFVQFELDARRIPEALRLRSVDNMYAVLYDYNLEGLQQDTNNVTFSDALNRIKSEISRINWKTAVECWEIAHEKQLPGGTESELMREFVRNGANRISQQNSLRFRVTCKRAGEKSQHNFSSMDAAQALGGQINNVFGWRADMKNFDMELLLNIRYDCMLVMVALNRESLFKRNICAFGPTTMRPTMCYCMAALAQPNKGDIILDPMCGGGSIPLEGALAYDGCLFIGADTHPKAMQRCSENMKYCDQQLLNNGSEVAFLCCDALLLPFPTSSINAIVTDLPFGKKIGSVGDNRVMYPRLLVEWERVVKGGGRLVVMTHDKRSWERALALNGGRWRTTRRRMVNVGGLQTLCSLLINTKNSQGFHS